jgi:hypothetical protein
VNGRPLLESVRDELSAVRAVLEDVHDAAQHALGAFPICDSTVGLLLVRRKRVVRVHSSAGPCSRRGS